MKGTGGIMSNRRIGKWLSLFILLAMACMPIFSSAYAEGPISPTADSPGHSPKTSHRLIVELASAPLAVWSAATSAPSVQGTRSRVDVTSAAAQNYLARLRGEQATFVQALHGALP